MTPRTLSLVAPILTALAVACGSSPSGDLSGFEGATGTGGAGSGAGTGGGAPSLGGEGSGAATPPSAGACTAAVSATADPRPVYLVFIYDRSGSMTNNNLWQNSRDATLAFFESADSKGMSASLKYFPDNNECSDATYTTPHIAMTALPDPIFRQVMMSKSPGGGTPTKPALRGAIQYAQGLAQGQAKDGKVAVVLVTDGQPNDCGSSIGDLAADASRVKATIPTYVVGLGNLVGLDAVASAGGTGKALIVSNVDPTKTKAELQAALKQIQQSALACEYKLPAAPPGQTIDYGKVNVVHTPQGAGGTTLTYSQDCSKEGWRYDDPKAPTRIELCKATCDRVSTAAGKVEVQVGCATQGGVPR
jgi:hypothetical protein